MKRIPFTFLNVEILLFIVRFNSVKMKIIHKSNLNLKYYINIYCS